MMVRSMATLMESALEDGEDAMVIANDYIDVLCLVTSTTGAMSFDTRELVGSSAYRKPSFVLPC